MLWVLAKCITAPVVKAIECLIFSDSIFKNADENEILNLLDLVEGYGAKTYAVDSSTDIGLRISSYRWNSRTTPLRNQLTF